MDIDMSRLDWVCHYLLYTVYYQSIFSGVYGSENFPIYGVTIVFLLFFGVTTENLRLLSLPTICRIIVLSLLFEMFESYIGNLIADMAICI